MDQQTAFALFYLGLTLAGSVALWRYSVYIKSLSPRYPTQLHKKLAELQAEENAKITASNVIQLADRLRKEARQ